ncbi:Regulatory protein SoxS [Marinomonas spartinae]|uniref:Regulatory protein SoxS n=1 Tax=Marinomonas spartinae TaxID=1792290 RepID=A0A1A8T6H9_9GAMM|nr:AraC family transcriptional regulator [Marinomonas spartinae]SBS26694.1 Regulatory protein SoxS [Marinomonas spartinae]
MTPTTHPIFWRDAALPYIELRQVLEGERVRYSPHTHQEWSIGAVLDGQSEFFSDGRLHQVKAGSLVFMNPNVVHACNPRQDSPWAYYMMHIEPSWLANVLYLHGLRSVGDWQNTRLDTLTIPSFYQDFVALCQAIMSHQLTVMEKEGLLIDYFVALFRYLDTRDGGEETLLPPNRLYLVASYLDQHCLEEMSLDLISEKFGYSTSYLVRAFKRHFNMTPHAYRLNRRVQLGKQALKQGQAISSVAQTVGFSDQAHFQRVFKQRVAATPDQYRRSMSS